MEKGSFPKFENLSLAYLITYHYYVSFRLIIAYQEEIYACDGCMPTRDTYLGDVYAL